MRNTKKYYGALCIAVMAATIISGCGSTAKKEQTSKSTPQTKLTEISSDAADTEATAQANPTDAPVKASKSSKKIYVNKTFVSKSTEKNVYQETYTPASNAKSPDSLVSWNDTSIKQKIVEFVTQATDPASSDYIPPEDRIVVTDIDGTLIAEKAVKINNDKMTKKTPGEVRDYLLKHQNDYFDESKNRKYCEIVYKPMVEMYEYLKANDFDIYFVSGNCNSLTYAWANYYFNADYAHSIGSNLILISDDSKGVKMGPSGKYEGCWNEVKSYRIYNQIGKCPVLGFGNSDGDVHMLSWIKTNPDYKSLSVMINHDDDKREYAYSVDSITKACKQNGILNAKMSKNFKQVFMNE